MKIGDPFNEKEKLLWEMTEYVTMELQNMYSDYLSANIGTDEEVCNESVARRAFAFETNHIAHTMLIDFERAFSAVKRRKERG